jgi:hypothetical protein
MEFCRARQQYLFEPSQRLEDIRSYCQTPPGADLHLASRFPKGKKGGEPFWLVSHSQISLSLSSIR